MNFRNVEKIGFLNEGKNKILISGIIGSIILLFDIINNASSVIITIEFNSGLVATILCFVYYKNRKQILPLISSIFFSVSSLYNIFFTIFILYKLDIFIFNIYSLLIILAVICFFVFVKNKNKSI